MGLGGLVGQRTKGMNMEVRIDIKPDLWVKSLITPNGQVQWGMKRKRGAFVGTRHEDAIIADLEQLLGWSRAECERLYLTIEEEGLIDIANEIIDETDGVDRF